MGWLSKLMFWRDEPSVSDNVVEAVEGYTVDGCFVPPDDVVPDSVEEGADSAGAAIDSTIKNVTD